MSPECPTFLVRGRGVRGGVILLALCASLAAGFVAAASRPGPSPSPRDVSEDPLGTSGSSLAMCVCPETAATSPSRQ